MTVYAILPPKDKGQGYVTPWKGSEEQAWNNLKGRMQKTKEELEQLGYRVDEYTQEDVLSADEQMMLMGR